MLFSPATGLPKIKLISIPHADKLIHFGMFGILTTIFLFESYFNKTKLSKAVRFLLITTIIFSLVSEYIQYAFVSGRSGNIYDATADIVGVFVGLAVFTFILQKPLKKFYVK
jgi:VanZ family protein